jgi:hypothetical protein
MTQTFATSRTEALATLNRQALALVGEMIAAHEVNETVAAAMHSLDTTGTAYLGGLTVQLTRKAQDRVKAAAIRNMSKAQFDRYAYGL